MSLATHQSRVGSEETGHYFHLQLRLGSENIVHELAYYCPRCVPAIACGAYLHARLVGQSADQEITVEQVIEALCLPPARSFHAWMAVQAFQIALRPTEPSSHSRPLQSH